VCPRDLAIPFASLDLTTHNLKAPGPKAGSFFFFGTRTMPSDPRVFLGIDVGTAGAKCVAVAEDHQVLASAYRGYDLVKPRENWVEQRPDDWWEALVEIVGEATQDIDRERIVSLSISSQGDTLVPVDEGGRPLYNAISWLDQRSSAQCERALKARDREYWFSRTGNRLGPYCSLAKIMWLADRVPEAAGPTAKFALVGDYITHRLTGVFAADASNASRTVLYDIEKQDWCDELLEIAGVHRGQMSAIYEPGAPVAELTPEASELLGLRKETLVCAGGHDQTCAALGAAVTEQGQCMLSCGTAWVVLSTLDRASLAPHMELSTYRHTAKGKYAMLGAYAGGAVFKWLKDELCEPVADEAARSGRDPYDLLTESAQKCGEDQVGQLLFLPHFYGSLSPSWEPNARGVLIGLTLHHKREHLARAVLEGIGLETLANIEVMRGAGIDVRELRMIGGGAKSEFWAQMIADITGATIAVPEATEAACLGAALLAGIGVGVYRDEAEAVANVRVSRTFGPRPELHEKYQELFALSRETFQQLREVSRRLARLGGT